MPDIVWHMLIGAVGGALGGYLGLGGGILIVPGLTVVLRVPILTAVPVSLSAIVVNSIAASNEYLKKGMVDFELVAVLACFMTAGNILGSSLSGVIPADVIQILFGALVLYAALSFLKSRNSEEKLSFTDGKKHHLFAAGLLTLLAGTLAGLLGVGGGVIIVPLLYLFVGVPLSSARGTSSFTIGFSAAAALAVYLLMGRFDVEMGAAVILGSIVGARIGGRIGALAKPKAVKILFFLVMVYLAFKLMYDPIRSLL